MCLTLSLSCVCLPEQQLESDLAAMLERALEAEGEASQLPAMRQEVAEYKKAATEAVCGLRCVLVVAVPPLTAAPCGGLVCSRSCGQATWLMN